VFDDEIEVCVRVSRLGRTSVTFEFAAHRVPDDALMVTAHQTLVYVDLAERKADPVPESFRAPVIAFEGDDVDA
jgi:acyl-CoA thioester hydrolase